MIGNEKSSPVLKTPHKICIVVKDCSVTSHSRSQEQNISQKVSITLQWNIKCSMDSTSLLQNVDNGESNMYKTTKIKGLPRLETNSAIFKKWSQRHFISVIAENKPHTNQVTIPFLINPHLIQWKFARIDEQTNKAEVPTLTLWIHSRGKRQTFFPILLC